MKNTTTKYQRVFAATAAVAALSALFLSARPALACPECDSKLEPGTYTGAAQRVGNGVAYSWVTLDEKGKPSSIGVTLTETALEGLTQIQEEGKLGPEYTLTLPKEAMKTAFQHISLGWNPKGHEPPGVYDRPHFDFHFYMITPEDREKITATGEDIARCQKIVPSAFAPAGYIYAKGTEVPMMGGHWVDPKAPELNGQLFTKTFLYGSYDGKMIHFEPMITKAFLESKPNFEQVIQVPGAYLKSAYYPTRYSIRHDPVRQEYVVALEGMTWRESTAEPKPAAAKTATTAGKPAGKKAAGKTVIKKANKQG